MIKSYFHIAVRNLKRNKSYLLVNVFGLGLGMTSAIIIFTLVKFHLSFDQFHKEPERIYRIVTEMHRDDIGYTNSVPSPLGKFLRNDYDFEENIARLVTLSDAQITIGSNEQSRKFKEENTVAFAEPSFFEIFSFPLIDGNKPSLTEDPNKAIITQKMATKYFGTSNPVGKTMMLDNEIPLTVAGILKDLPAQTDHSAEIFISYPTVKAYDESYHSDKSWGGIRSAMQCFIKLKPGVDPHKVESVTAAYVKTYRPTNKNVHHYKLQPLSEIHFDPRYQGKMEKRNLWILSIIGIFLVITACLNFINLATAQALKRSREVGVRKVLGGFRKQIFWQFIIETLVISFVALLFSISLAYLIFPLLNDWFSMNLTFSIFKETSLIGFSLLLTLVIAIISGSYPGLVLAKFKPVLALKGKISQQNIGGFNTRRSLVIIQFAITQILIIGMVVVLYQLQFTKTSDLGFKKDAIVMVPLGVDTTGTKKDALKNELLKQPGVEAVSLCSAPPASDDNWGNFIRFDNSTEEVNFSTSIKLADDKYLSTFEIPLIAGNNLSTSDTVREFLVNEAFVRKLNFKQPQDIIGKIVAANGGRMRGPVVGVMKDFHDKSFHDEINPIIISTNSSDYESYAVKLKSANLVSAMAGVERSWSAQFPDQIYEYKFLDESIAEFYTTEELMQKLIQTFSLIAIMISCLGLFGLIKFMAAQKTREIGIRKILGGRMEQIIWIFGKEFSVLILIAFLIAAPIAWLLMNQWLQDFKYRIAIGSEIFLIAIAGTFLIALITVSYQTVKAARANPVKSLRSE